MSFSRSMVALGVVLVAVGAILLAPSAAAAKPCWQQVIDDWADNSRVDGRYPIPCYQKALAKLPEDMRAYSTAPDDIARAMREEVRRRQAGTPVATADDEEEGAPAASPPKGGQGPKNRGENEEPAFFRAGDPGQERPTSDGLFAQALDEIGPSSGTSFPLPLLIVGGLAGLFLAVGGLGFVVRRIQAKGPRPSGN